MSTLPEHARLNVAWLERLEPLGDHERAIATIIAAETEAQREVERPRVHAQWASIENPNALLPGPDWQVDTLRWDVLLTFGDCASRAAARAGVDVAELLRFALGKCAPLEPWALFWFDEALRAYRNGGNAEMQARHAAAKLADLKDEHDRLRASRSLGGKKAAESRRRNPPVISMTDRELLREESRLLASGHEQHEVAGLIAGRHGWKPDSVRKRLRNARKSEP